MEQFGRSKCGIISDCIIIIMLQIIHFVLQFQLGTYQQYIPHTNNVPTSTFQYPDKSETAPNSWLPLGIIELLFLFNLLLFKIFDDNFSFRNWLKNFFLMNRMFLFCSGITSILVVVIKRFVGSPTPNYMALMQKFENGEFDEEPEWIRWSFVNGTAAYAIAYFFLLTIMMYNAFKYTQSMYYNQMTMKHMTCGNPHSYYFSSLWCLMREIPLLSMIIVSSPTIIAIFIALTQIRDYQHFAVDVIGGILVGVCTAIVSYLVYWNETYFMFNVEQKIQFNQANGLP